MSITDELRAWAKEHLSRSSILAIADRIDAEHESACAEAYGNGVMSVPIALDESAWVELPKDADGVPIHIGDEVEEVDYDGHASVFEVRMTADGWWVCAGGICRRPDRYRHYHAPTVEDVLREFTDAILEWSGKSGTVAEVGTWSDIAADYAAKLRLAEEEDA